MVEYWPLKRHLSILAAILFTLPCFAAAKTNNVIRSTAELAQIISRKSPTGGMFEIQGTVYSVPFKRRHAFFIIQDGRCVSLIDFRKEDAPELSPGDRILARGSIDPRNGLHPDGFVNANCTETILLGHDPPPRHIPITASDIDRNDMFNRPVSICGTVVDRRIDEIDPKFTLFVLDCSNRMVYAASRIPYDEFHGQIGSMVSVKGVLTRHIGKRIHQQWIIHAQLPDAITVVKSPSGDWFHAPEIGETADLSPDAIIALGRRKAVGLVLAVWNGDMLLMRTTSNNLVKVNLVASPPAIGACIEVVGYAETDLFRVNLSRAIWQPAPAMQLPPEKVESVTARSLLTDAAGNRKFNVDYHGKIVNLRGMVRDLPPGEPGGKRIVLDSDGYTVMVDCSSVPAAAERLETGAEISVTGVCVMETENWNQHSMLPKVTGMFISVSSPDDIKILATPPWWTPFKLMVVIGVLVLLIVAILIWNVSLRKLSERRGRELYRNQIARAESELRVDERTRLAAELHDHLAQNLTAISYQIAAAERSSKVAPESSAHHLETAARMLGSCRTELRRCLWDLRNDALDEPYFAQAIRKSVEPVAGEAEVAVEFNIPRSRISDSTAHAMLSIIRELSANAANHGHARTIRIAGELARGVLDFSVSDDGCGFDVAVAPGLDDGHFGLDGVRERVCRHGGKLSIESTPGRGTRVAITLHLPSNEGTQP